MVTGILKITLKRLLLFRIKYTRKATLKLTDAFPFVVQNHKTMFLQNYFEVDLVIMMMTMMVSFVENLIQWRMCFSNPSLLLYNPINFLELFQDFCTGHHSPNTGHYPVKFKCSSVQSK